MRRTEDLNPYVQSGEQPGAIPDEETMPADSVPESPGAQRFAEESATTADGVGDREQLVTMVADVMEMPGVMAGATESLEAGA